MITVCGPLMDRDGMVRQRRFVQGPGGALETRTRQWATPSAGVRRRQASRIPVDLSHDHNWIGKVKHLERDAQGRIWCAAMIEDRYEPPAWLLPLYFSPSLIWNEGSGDDVEITSVGITDSPGQRGQLPVQFLKGDIKFRGATKQWGSVELDSHRRALLERAASARVLRASGAPILVCDADELDLDGLDAGERYRLRSEDADAWMLQPMRYRPGRVIAVR